ncbi:hypothetical protein B0J17DRAFT_641006 [Rhizoctonia solani]|nr:hypothetical protein B0J17DRAFT_641006 [Rhizoctonia solani]
MSPNIIEQLDNVTTVLHDALDNYISFDAILDRVANEVQLVTSCGEKLKRIEESIKTFRNSTSTIVPISSLPPEILTRIFRIVLDDQPDLVDATHAPLIVSLSSPKYPETLSHVCSGWRRIAVASHELWSRIDLVLHHPLGPGLLARAKAQVNRVGPLSLDVRIIDPPLDSDYSQYNELDDFEDFEDFDFLASSQTPMSTLSLVSYRGLQLEHYNFIFYCISNCAQQTLKKLVIWDVCGYGSPQCFIESACNPQYPGSLQIELSEQILEGVWHSTSVLHLAGIYPYWTSRAYHQLVDLRLGSNKTGGRASVSEVEIINILKASPGLRVFHLHLHLTDSLPDDSPILPIQLDELESVNLSSFLIDPSRVLRFITPGRKPLRLSIFGAPTDATEQFFRRSNVTQLRMIRWEDYPLANALRLCPNLSVLVLDGWGSTGATNIQTTPEQGVEDAQVAHRSIPTMYMLRCKVTMACLQHIVEVHSVQELTLWKTHPEVLEEHAYDWPRNFQTADEAEIPSLCPVVNYPEDGASSPIDDWDLF